MGWKRLSHIPVAIFERSARGHRVASLFRGVAWEAGNGSTFGRANGESRCFLCSGSQARAATLAHGKTVYKAEQPTPQTAVSNHRFIMQTTRVCSFFLVCLCSGVSAIWIVFCSKSLVPAESLKDCFRSTIFSLPKVDSFVTMLHPRLLVQTDGRAGLDLAHLPNWVLPGPPIGQ